MKRQIALIVSSFLLLFGCASVGPNYRKPDLVVQREWSESRQSPQAPAEALAQSAWWKNFNDSILDDLITEAVNANLDLKQAQSRIREARSQVKIAGAAVLPQIGASAAFSRSQLSLTTTEPPGGDGLATTYSAGFDASWEIDIFGGTRRSIEASQADLEADIEDANSVLLTLLGDVARNYVELRSFQQQIIIALHNTDAQRSTAELTHSRYETGLASYLDVAEAQALLSRTESNIPSLEAGATQSIHRLGILLGKGPNVLKGLLTESKPIPAAPPVGPTGVPSELLTRRPDIRRAERQLAGASARIGVATADLFPKFNITAAFGLASSSTATVFQNASRQWSLVPGLTLPLFSGGKITAAIESKRALYDETLFRYQDTVNKALEEVENALSALYAENRRYESLLAAQGSGALAVELAEIRYKGGFTAFLDVLTAQRNLYVTQVSLSQSESALSTSYIALYKALGGGWQVFGENSVR
jgi:outer membrane protein, multidrug efflux system